MFDRIHEGVYWDRPWTLVSGCTPCSPGCEHCWALAMERRFKRNADTCPNGSIQIHPERLKFPLWRRKPAVWAVWNDLFHKDVPWDFIGKAFSMMKNDIFLILTKRITRALKFYSKVDEWGGWWTHNGTPPESYGGNGIPMGRRWPIPNIWLGVTVCNQKEADAKIPILLQIPAARRWVSIEPMLGPVDLTKINYQGSLKNVQPGVDLPFRVLINSLIGEFDDGWDRGKESKLDWVVLGGETGSGARPIEPRWARNVKDQCVEAGVPFFFKSWGWNKADYIGRPKNRLLDDREWNELPPVKACLEE